MMRQALPNETEAKRRARLGSFGFSAEKVETCGQDLSGGERARLLLNMVAMSAPHLLILDEPTNHLDIDSRRALLEAINDYRGAVLIIAHDRALLEMVADRFWIADNGTIKPFDGDMDDYAKYVIEKAKTATKGDGGQVKKEAGGLNARELRQARAAARIKLAPLKAKVDELMKKIEAKSAKIAEIDTLLADKNLYLEFPEKAVTHSKTKSNLVLDKETLEIKWLEAAESYEIAKTEAGL
jgi:ATP-binding cassette subfamily F protein 3